MKFSIFFTSGRHPVDGERVLAGVVRVDGPPPGTEQLHPHVHGRHHHGALQTATGKESRLLFLRTARSFYGSLWYLLTFLLMYILTYLHTYVQVIFEGSHPTLKLKLLN